MTRGKIVLFSLLTASPSLRTIWIIGDVILAFMLFLVARHTRTMDDQGQAALIALGVFVGWLWCIVAFLIWIGCVIVHRCFRRDYAE